MNRRSAGKASRQQPAAGFEGDSGVIPPPPDPPEPEARDKQIIVRQRAIASGPRRLAIHAQRRDGRGHVEGESQPQGVSDAMLKVTTANLNGIRSAASKGFFDWVPAHGADLLGVQEIKAHADVVEGAYCTVKRLKGHFHYAQKPGYSGVGLYSFEEPSDVITGLGVPEFDEEGRWVEKRFDKPGRKLSVISAYFPSGSSGEDRQAAKFRFLEVLYPHLLAMKQQRDFILMGDINIAHKEIDLKNWKGNQKNSGFLPEERAWMTKLTQEAGLVDVYRMLEPHATESAYTWWSNRGQAYAKNVGWRLDYQIATAAIARTARAATVYKVNRFSDHAPLTVDYDMSL
jgi:exodeoxyribonuclease-3